MAERCVLQRMIALKLQCECCAAHWQCAHSFCLPSFCCPAPCFSISLCADPTSHGNSGFSIAARFDLSTFDPIPRLGWFSCRTDGAIDTKITGAAWMENDYRNLNNPNVTRCSVINGPTYQDQPVFSWADAEWTNVTSHLGHPTAFTFSFVQFSYTQFQSAPECQCNSAQTCHLSDDGLSYSCSTAPKVIVGAVVGSVLSLALLAGCCAKWQHGKKDRAEAAAIQRQQQLTKPAVEAVDFD